MYGVDALKSVILTLAAAERVISIEEAVRQSRLEENYQVCIIICILKSLQPTYVSLLNATLLFIVDFSLGFCRMVP